MAIKLREEYGAVVARRKIFYRCDCPPHPRSNNDRDIIEWYMHHVNTCPPRYIQDIHLPPYEGDE